MAWQLLETFDTREDAESELHHYAATLRNMGQTDEFGVAVFPTRGAWGIWAKDRRREDPPPA